MDRTNGSLLCSLVSIIAGLVFVGIIIVTLGNAVLSNPGVSQLMNVLGH